MPEDTQTTLVLVYFLNGLEGVVHSEVLVILGEDLVQPSCSFLEKNEVLYYV